MLNEWKVDSSQSIGKVLSGRMKTEVWARHLWFLQRQMVIKAARSHPWVEAFKLSPNYDIESLPSKLVDRCLGELSPLRLTRQVRRLEFKVRRQMAVQVRRQLIGVS